MIGQSVPKTPRGKHSEGAGKPAGSKSQGSFSIVGKATIRVLTRILTGKDKD